MEKKQQQNPPTKTETRTQKQKTRQTRTAEASGRVSFMDTFNVEVTVTLMLNMLDEVTNTVQLIKSDYWKTKPNLTKQNRDTTTDSAPLPPPPLWSGHHDSHVLRLRSNDAELWRRD